MKTPKHVLLPLTVQQLTKNTELLTLINNCSAACSCNNCSNSTEEGSVVGNDDMPMDDDIDEQEDYNNEVFQFSVFQDMCSLILCSNGVLDATCHKHTFFLRFSFTFLVFYNTIKGLAIFWLCMFLFVITTIVLQLRSTTQWCCN